MRNGYRGSKRVINWAVDAGMRALAQGTVADVSSAAAYGLAWTLAEAESDAIGIGAATHRRARAHRAEYIALIASEIERLKNRHRGACI